MQAAAKIHGPADEAYKIREMRLGANWFFWVAIAGVANSLLIYFFSISSLFFGLGMTNYIDNHFTFDGLGGRSVTGLLANIGIALVLAGFGYLSRRGNDVAFIIGMFLYIFDTIVVLGYREFFAFGFHLMALFFMFKGLLASRRRYDPSVE